VVLVMVALLLLVKCLAGAWTARRKRARETMAVRKSQLT